MEIDTNNREIQSSPEDYVAELLNNKRRMKRELFEEELAQEYEDIREIVRDLKKQGFLLVTRHEIYNPFEISYSSVKNNIENLSKALNESSSRWQGKIEAPSGRLVDVEEDISSFHLLLDTKDWLELRDHGLEILLKIHKIQNNIDEIIEWMNSHIAEIVTRLRRYIIGAGMLTATEFDLPSTEWQELGFGQVLESIEQRISDIDNAVFKVITDEPLGIKFKEIFFKKEVANLKDLPNILIEILHEKGIIERRITLSDTITEQLQEVSTQSEGD